MDNNEKDDFDLQGRLGCFTLSDLLQTLSFTQKTGTLTLIQGWNTRTICYEQGRITYIAAATRLPTAVELLLGNGKLTVPQIERKLGKNWKVVLGMQPPAQPVPDSMGGSTLPGMNGMGNGTGGLGTNGLNGHGSNGNGRASLTQVPHKLSTDPDLAFGDIEAFVPPDFHSSQDTGSVLDAG